MTWQPIESAPKDGTEVLLFEFLPHHEPMVRVGYWEENGTDLHSGADGISGWSLVGEGYIGEIEPTHWMPLPEPPELQP
jgi:hypothetical protein